MPDKRDECGCHKRCIVLPHDCEKKCVWPNCLTEEEHAELGADLEKDCTYCPDCDMTVNECELFGCPRRPDKMHAANLVREYANLHGENERLSEENSELRTANAVLETFRDRVYSLVPREEHISDHDVVEWLLRMREALAQRLDPIETALEAQLGETEEKVRQIGQRLQEMASSGDLNRYVIQDCADALLGRGGSPGSEFDRER